MKIVYSWNTFETFNILQFIVVEPKLVDSGDTSQAVQIL